MSERIYEKDPKLVRAVTHHLIDVALSEGAPAGARSVALVLVRDMLAHNRLADTMSRAHIAKRANLSPRQVTRVVRWLADHDAFMWFPGSSIPGKTRVSSRVVFPRRTSDVSVTSDNDDTGDGMELPVTSSAPTGDIQRADQGHSYVPHPVSLPVSLPVGVTRPPSPPTHDALVERLIGTCKKKNKAEAVRVIDHLRRHVDVRLIDQGIGSMSQYADPPKYPRVLLSTVASIANNVRIPELRFGDDQ